jgi:hypothetical protein
VPNIPQVMVYDGMKGTLVEARQKNKKEFAAEERAAQRADKATEKAVGGGAVCLKTPLSSFLCTYIYVCGCVYINAYLGKTARHVLHSHSWCFISRTELC